MVEPQNGGVVHAGDTEGNLYFYTAADLWAWLPARRFAGVVFVRDGYRAEDYPVIPASPPSESDERSDSDDY